MPIFTDKSLQNMYVVTRDGHVIGVVDEVGIDTEVWRVEHIGVKLHRENLEALNLKKPWFRTQAIKIETRKISGVGDAVVLHDNLEELEFFGGTREDSSEARPS